MGVPGSHIGFAAEPVPADDRNAEYRDNHPPDSDGTDLASDARPTEVGDCGYPQHGDGRNTDSQRRQSNAKQLRTVTDGGNSDGNIGDQQGNAIGIVGHKVAGLAEGIFSVTSHAAGFAVEHATFGKRIGQCHGSHGGDQPGNNRNSADLASLVGSIIMPEPIIFTAVRIVNCMTPILLFALLMIILTFYNVILLAENSPPVTCLIKL